ncbi:MAG: YbaK/EbsC family protein [Candidatus Methylomirabilia bacterium]
MGTLHPAAQRVQAALGALGIQGQIRQLPQSSRTAPEAARAVGTTVGQIVKSLIFMAGEEAVLVCTSGSNRASLDRLTELTGQPVRQASADEVRAATGFAIGGVPPVGHTNRLRTFIDRDLTAHGELYAAAGTPSTLFRTTPEHLIQMSQGEVADVKE